MLIIEGYHSSVVCLMRVEKHPRPRAGSNTHQPRLSVFYSQDGTFRGVKRSLPLSEGPRCRAPPEGTRWTMARRATTIQAIRAEGWFCVGPVAWVTHPPAAKTGWPPAGRCSSVGWGVARKVHIPMAKSYYSVPIVKQELLPLWYEAWDGNMPVGRETDKNGVLRQTRIIKAGIRLKPYR